MNIDRQLNENINRYMNKLIDKWMDIFKKIILVVDRYIDGRKNCYV